MKKVIEFYLSNKDWINPLICLLISVISAVVVASIKRKKVLNEADLILVDVFEKLPELINQAEILKGSEVKKSFVLKCVQDYVKEKFSVNLNSSLLGLIGQQIEMILSTPKKH